MADIATMLKDLINPQVLADMVSAKVENRVMALPYAKIDTTLQGRAGDTITVPRYGYTFGEAVEVAEGEDIPLRTLDTSTVQHTIKKIGIGGTITDEAILSGYGDPMGQIVHQMAIAISNKLDADTIDEVYTATTSYVAGKALCYDAVVNAIDLFNEEINTEKVMFVNPKQITQLRLDENFISADKYQSGVMLNGEIGRICNSRIVPSRKVRLVSYVVDPSGSITIDAENIEEYQAKVDPSVTLKVGNKVKELAAAAQYYVNPIIKLTHDSETEDDFPALTMYVKRDTNVETERIARSRKTEITGDKMYVVVLSDDSKVVLAKCLAQSAVAAG